jgi:hypothetical protein
MTAQMAFKFNKPQWQRVLEMLQTNRGGVTTGMFCSAKDLSAEYRRAVSELRKKGYIITATRLRAGCFNYILENA